MSKPKKARPNSLLGGEVFGRITVVSYSHSVKRSDGVFGERVMNCQCECGKKIKVRTSNLRSGNTKSCGCFHSERTIAANKERASLQGGTK